MILNSGADKNTIDQIQKQYEEEEIPTMTSAQML
jgi:hypothetical protein